MAAMEVLLIRRVWQRMWLDREPVTLTGQYVLFCVCIFLLLQQSELLSVMGEGRLPPIGTELLAAAFLPLLSGGCRGIICQQAGSHCLWAGTNAASFRQLDPGCVHTVCRGERLTVVALQPAKRVAKSKFWVRYCAIFWRFLHKQLCLFTVLPWDITTLNSSTPAQNTRSRPDAL